MRTWPIHARRICFKKPRDSRRIARRGRRPDIGAAQFRLRYQHLPRTRLERPVVKMGIVITQARQPDKLLCFRHSPTITRRPDSVNGCMALVL